MEAIAATPFRNALTKPMLTIRALATSVLKPASFDLGDGECVAVLGPSGAGKSVLLRAIADLDPASGEVGLDGVPRSAMTGPEWRRRVTYVAAESGWWADRVGDHFTDAGRAADGAESFGLPRDAMDWPVARLSTGERQRLALLRALEGQPRVLLLDEPTSGLDHEATERVERRLRAEMARGVALLLVTHALEQAERLASRRLRVDGGAVREV